MFFNDNDLTLDGPVSNHSTSRCVQSAVVHIFAFAHSSFVAAIHPTPNIAPHSLNTAYALQLLVKNNP